MKRTLVSLLSVVILGAGCAEAGPSKPAAETTSPSTYVEAERIPAEAAAAPEPQAGGQGQKYRDGLVRIKGRALEVTDGPGRVIASNAGIIRLRDENGDCPSEGFGRVVAKGDFFTIEQQNCGGMFFIDEYVTFKAGKDGKIWLHKFSIVKTDREDPDKKVPQRDLSTKDFGQVELKDVDLQRLYEMF